jgi:hypothetical protein
MSNKVENKPTAAYIVSLLGGIFGLLGSLAFIGLGALSYAAYSTAIDDYGFDYGYITYDSMFGWGWTALIGFGAWMLITSILIIVFAGKLKANPLEHSKWGVLILVFSLIGVGGLLGVIGGILALAYKPRVTAGYPPQAYPPQGYPQQTYPPAQPQNYQQPIARICPQCGRVVPENIKFCQNCGKQLN